jgi:Glycerol-3-phosphate acyltransferase C-terminal region
MKSDNRQLLKYLASVAGYRTLFLCNQVSVVEPAALVATILLTHFQRGLSRERLVRDCQYVISLLVCVFGWFPPSCGFVLFFGSTFRVFACTCVVLCAQRSSLLSIGCSLSSLLIFLSPLS